MELLYFTDISQIQFVIDTNRQLLETMLPITGDIVVASELERLQVRFIDEWDFLEPADIERNAELTYKVAINWGDENNAGTYYNGIALSSCATQEFAYPFEACLNAKIVYEKIFKEYSIDRISGFFLPSQAVIRTGPTPTHRAVGSVSQAVLFWLADKNGIYIEKLKSDYPLSQGIMPKKRLLQKAKIVKSKSSAHINRRIALVMYDTLSGSEHENLKDSLNKMGGWQVISIAKSDLGNYVPGKNEIPDIKKQFQNGWETFINSTLNYNGPYPEIFANPYLNFQFKGVWDEMELAVEYGNLFSTFIDVLQPSIIFWGHEAFTIERVFVALAQKRNIPAIGLLHGGIAHKFGHYRGIVGKADSILVWNDIDLAGLKLCTGCESKLYKIGSIRYEAMFDKYIKKSLNVAKELKSKAKKNLGVSSINPVVLMLTAAINTGFAGPVANPKKHREALNELITIIKSRGDLTFIIKAHPSYDYYEIYRRLHNLHLPNLIFLESATLDEALNLSDVCLLLNYFTTAALEAMLHCTPVIYLNNAVYPLPNWEENVPDFSINKIHSVADLEKKIDELLTDKSLRERTFNEADKIICQLLDVNETASNDRLIDFIKGIIKDEHTDVTGHESFYKICDSQFQGNITEEEIGGFLNKIILNHSIENSLYVFSFMAGSNNAGISGLFKLFNIFQKHLDNKNLLPWPESWLILLRYYILGYYNNSLGKDKYTAVKLIGQIIINSKQFIALPPSDRKQIIKYLVSTTIGQGISIEIINKLVLINKMFPA